MHKLLTGNRAAAWGARLSGVEYIPAFPITPQTEIIETLAAWIEAGKMQGRFVQLESEHSMVTAAGAGAATGVRVFTATSSQPTASLSMTRFQGNLPERQAGHTML